MPAFWHWFVAAGTILFIIWCIWLVSWSAKQGPQGVADEDLVGHKWDGDLEEWNNPAPKWWLYLYFITVFRRAKTRRQPVRKLLHDLPWVGRTRCAGLSKPRRWQVAVG
jgi:hypothetical protein